MYRHAMVVACSIMMIYLKVAIVIVVVIEVKIKDKVGDMELLDNGKAGRSSSSI